jgi:hypothetical protein
MEAVAITDDLCYFQGRLDPCNGYLVRHKRTHVLTIAIVAVTGTAAPDGVSHNQEALVFNHFIASKLVPACRARGY